MIGCISLLACDTRLACLKRTQSADYIHVNIIALAPLVEVPFFKDILAKFSQSWTKVYISDLALPITHLALSFPFAKFTPNYRFTVQIFPYYTHSISSDSFENVIYFFFKIIFYYTIAKDIINNWCTIKTWLHNRKKKHSQLIDHFEK